MELAWYQLASLDVLLLILSTIFTILILTILIIRVLIIYLIALYYYLLKINETFKKALEEKTKKID